MIDNLIRRLEKAIGPDRELDVAIVYALYPNIGQYQPQCVGDDPIFWHEPYRKQPAPRFTESVDAAMTLIPKGAFWELNYSPTAFDRLDGRIFIAGVGSIDRGPSTGARSPSPAIALCIAAFKSRQPVVATEPVSK